MIAKNWCVCVLLSSWRMIKAWSEVVEPSNRLKTYIVVRINLSYFWRNDIICMLHVYELGKSWNHHQRIMKMITRPRFIHYFIRNDVFTCFKSFCNFHPISDKEISQTMSIVPKRAKSLCYRISNVVFRPRMLATVLAIRKSILIKCKFFSTYR